MSKARELIRRETRAMVTEVKQAAALTAGGWAVVWVVTVIDWVLQGAIAIHSVVPRTLAGLWGILVMPFVHADLSHILANTVAGVPLAMLAMSRKRSDAVVVAGVAALTGGLGAWLLGSPGSLHIGASGVVFGWLGFLMGRGWFERRFGAILLSAMVTFLYGGALFTMIPGVAAGVSWQGHLFGFIGGLLVSRFVGEKLNDKASRSSSS